MHRKGPLTFELPFKKQYMVMMVGEAKQEDRDLKTSLCYVLREGRKERKETGRQAMEDKRRLLHGRETSHEGRTAFLRMNLMCQRRQELTQAACAVSSLAPLLLLLCAHFLYAVC